MNIISSSTLLVFFFLAAGIWLWAFIDVLTKKFHDPTQKLLWIVVVFIFPIVGPLAYFLLHRRFDRSSQRKFNPDFSKRG